MRRTAIHPGEHLAEQLEALDISGVGRKTTRHLLVAGIITDSDGVQIRTLAQSRSLKSS